MLSVWRSPPNDQIWGDADGRPSVQRLWLHGQNEFRLRWRWTAGPKGTKSYAVTLYDPDAPTGSGWWHWVVYNIPADVTELAAGAGVVSGKLLPPNVLQGRTDFGSHAFGGACPPAGAEASPLYFHRACAQG